MFNLTRQEKIVIVSLACAFLAGVGVLTYRQLAEFKTRKDLNACVIPPVSGPGAVPITTVKVSGAVLHPGSYEINAGGTVMEAVDKAVPLVEADLEALELDLPVGGRREVRVPFKNKTDRSEAAVEKVNINTATLEELDKLPGIGPRTAEKIIEFRKKSSFRDIEDLKNVDGIGDKKFDVLRDKIKAD